VSSDNTELNAAEQMRAPRWRFLYTVAHFLWRVYDRTLGPPLRRIFLTDLIIETGNFAKTTWLGRPIWQNVLDLQTMQETIWEVKPALLIECGTNLGGSALFFASLFQLMGTGRVLTIDLEKMHDLSHPLITFLVGNSLDPKIVAQAHLAASSVDGPIMVVLDSLHSASHVRGEMEAYCGLVTKGSYLFTQDGVIDELYMFRRGRPGPLKAIRDFARDHPEFEVDHARSRRFLITHSPMGWLRRK
jgi:cephalosporin hydroxylase